MLSKIFYLIVGVVLGVSVTYVSFYSDSYQRSDTNDLMVKILEHSNTSISDDNYSCEGVAVKTVGAVVASLLENNKINKVNNLKYGCLENTCRMSVSSCQPWQSNECSSRFLTFNINSNNEVEKNSFNCFDMP